MNYLLCIILILFGIYMFTQPDNFYEYMKIRKTGREEMGDPTKLDYHIIKGAGIFFIVAAIVLAVKTFLA